ncbi:MBL fold metallo-hydrolase [Paracoccus sp. M683]|uniref:MBL fold metallo-hydrolase n=1 Tax=Paracoccus sp. M683 TaxID=2594268 RepID=UPI001C8F9687|nr:MBL fold metallo-hydrolase [Paracoccus sp. M683]
MTLAAPVAMAETRVIVLGTGTPVPNGDRAGSGLAIIHDGEAYLFDAGHGMMQNAIKAWKDLDAEELNPTKIKQVFITHLHSDHTLDYPELASTYWWRREERLKAIGPKGLQAMTDGFYEMMQADIAIRTSGVNPVKDPSMYQVDVTEIEQDGVVFDENGVTVEAFTVDHGEVKPAYGFKVTTPDRTIVISGDTAYSETLIEKAKGVDILVHEVIGEEGLRGLSPEWQEYHRSVHTLTSELADIANQAQPGTLVLTHIATYAAPLETAKTEVEALYDGKVVLASDLDEF